MLRKKRTELKDDVSAAVNAALALLARREYSQFELLAKLKAKYTPEAAQQALERCLENNWQSDLRTADMLLRHAVFAKNGPKKLYMDLKAKRLSPELLHKLEDYPPDWTHLAYEAAASRYKIIDKTEMDYQFKCRVRGFLYRRGFSTEQCRRACEELLGTDLNEV